MIVYNKMIECLEYGVNSGYVKAMEHLGMIYFAGIPEANIKSDYKMAHYLFEKADTPFTHSVLAMMDR